jgi:hypothetical protein
MDVPKHPAAAHDRVSEVYDEPYLETSGFEIGKGDSHVRLVDHVDRLDLDNNLPVDDEVDAVEANWNTVVADAHGKLPLVGDLPLVELNAHGLLIDTLEKAGAKLLVNLNCGGVDFAGQVAMEISRDVGHVSKNL